MILFYFCLCHQMTVENLCTCVNGQVGRKCHRTHQCLSVERFTHSSCLQPSLAEALLALFTSVYCFSLQVMEAEQTRTRSELAHRETAAKYNAAISHMKQLEKKLKRTINKSRLVIYVSLSLLFSSPTVPLPLSPHTT